MPAGWSTYREEDEFSASARDTHADKTVDKLLAEKLAQDPAISAALVVLSGNHASRVKPLVITGDKQTWVIGREGNADLQFSDVSISARHAALIHDDGVWRIEDKDSTNGVKVNNNKEGRRLLQDRDSINLGGVEMVFCLPKRS